MTLSLNTFSFLESDPFDQITNVRISEEAHVYISGTSKPLGYR